MDSHISKTLGDSATRLTEMEQHFSALTARMCKFEDMLPQHQMFPVRQDPGLHSNKLTAPEPQGPTAQGHLMTTETHDEGLILPQAQKMNNHEVPVLFRFPCEQDLKGITKWIDTLWKSLICWHATNLLEFIAQQVPCQSSLFLKHEANAKTLLFDIRLMVFLKQLTVPSGAPTLLSQCVQSRSMEDREIGKQFVPFLEGVG